MKCYFCQEPISSSELFKSENYEGLRIGDCPYCKSDRVTTTMVTVDGKLVSAHLYVQWGEERYQFLLHFGDGFFALVHVTAETETGRNQIYTTREMPDINFRNVLSKLPLYLTFL